MLSQKSIRSIFLEHLPQFSKDSISIKLVEIGNQNFVYRISTPKETFYLKHGLNYERNKTIFTDHFKLRKNRIKKEVNFIKFLRKNLTSFEDVFPVPIYFDEKDNFFIMTDVAKDKKLLKNELDGGIVDLHIIESLAKFIAQQHSVPIDDIEDDLFFNDILFFRTVLSANKLDKPFQEKIKKEYNKIINEKHHCLVKGDFSPRHVFYNKNKFGVCDLEFCCLGDSAYDVGFFLAHYKLAGIINQQIAEKTDQAVKYFIETYINQTKNTLDQGQFKSRVNFYIGTCMLNRIDGAPRDKPLSEEIVKRIRQEAKDLVD